MSRPVATTSILDPNALHRRLALAGCLAAILGAKILLIARFAVSTPYWDQWDAEAAGLYLPYLNGTLTPSSLFAFHNEHRIMLTRASALALLRLNGTWDAIVQMLANAALHVAALGLLLALLGRLLDLPRFLLFATFALLLLAVPFGWDNTLAGFQTPYYYLILISLPSLYLTCHAPAFGVRWLTGTLLGAIGYFALVSGALTLLAAAALAGMQYLAGRRRGGRELAGIALQVAVAVFAVRDAMSYPSPLSAGLGAAISSFLTAASWPIAAASWPAVLRFVPALLMNAPLLILIKRMLADQPGLADRRWFVLALAGWLALQIAALSYGRPGGTPESRYSDIFLILVLVNAAAWLCLLGTLQSHGLRLIASVWLFAVMLGAGQKATNNVVDGIAARAQTGRIQTDNVRGFVATGDFAYLAGKPYLHIPFASAEQLRELLSDPKLRTILPPALTGAPEGRIKSAILSHGPMLLPLGLALMWLAALACYRRRASGDAAQSF